MPVFHAQQRNVCRLQSVEKNGREACACGLRLVHTFLCKGIFTQQLKTASSYPMLFMMSIMKEARVYAVQHSFCSSSLNICLPASDL
eukprot:1155962-Pelagomonas_calceolata.AAC.11